VQRRFIPLRLLDCFGFATPSPFTIALLDALVVVDARLGPLLIVGLGTLGVGLLRNTDGEGMLIVAIYAVRLPYVGPEL